MRFGGTTKVPAKPMPKHYSTLEYREVHEQDSDRHCAILDRDRSEGTGYDSHHVCQYKRTSLDCIQLQPQQALCRLKGTSIRARIWPPKNLTV